MPHLHRQPPFHRNHLAGRHAGDPGRGNLAALLDRDLLAVAEYPSRAGNAGGEQVAAQLELGRLDDRAARRRQRGGALYRKREAANTRREIGQPLLGGRNQ